MAARLTGEGLGLRTLESGERGFPFERVETTGEQALTTWKQLKATGRGIPVVVGGDRSVGTLMTAFNPRLPVIRTAPQILAVANGLRHPQDLITKQGLDEARARKHSQGLFETRKGPPIGKWPVEAESISGLSVAVDSYGKPLQTVYIALMPTEDWTTVPAHLRWGGWDDCPPPEYHVAALRSWRDRFGAELVGLSSNRMDLNVTRPPQTRPEALDLAREHYVYCSDIVHQGLGTLSALAARLMGNAWWAFWWD
jgi:hypothetical protein